MSNGRAASDEPADRLPRRRGTRAAVDLAGSRRVPARVHHPAARRLDPRGDVQRAGHPSHARGDRRSGPHADFDGLCAGRGRRARRRRGRALRRSLLGDARGPLRRRDRGRVPSRTSRTRRARRPAAADRRVLQRTTIHRRQSRFLLAALRAGRGHREIADSAQRRRLPARPARRRALCAGQPADQLCAIPAARHPADGAACSDRDFRRLRGGIGISAIAICRNGWRPPAVGRRPRSRASSRLIWRCFSRSSRSASPFSISRFILQFRGDPVHDRDLRDAARSPAIWRSAPCSRR